MNFFFEKDVSLFGQNETIFDVLLYMGTLRCRQKFCRLFDGEQFF